MGQVRSPKRRVRDHDFILGSCSECPRIDFLLAKLIERFSAEILNFKISWQAHYLLELEDDSWCSAHCTGRFIETRINHEIHFFVAGAIFGKVLASLSWQAQHSVRI